MESANHLSTTFPLDRCLPITGGSKCVACGGKLGTGYAGVAPDWSGVVGFCCWETIYPPATRDAHGFVVLPYPVNPNWQRDCRLRARGSVIAKTA